MASRTADARWEGNLQDGHGVMRLGGGAYEGPYTAKSRFEEGEGTNPEELIAAAHAGCFSMFLANVLAQAGHDVRTVETTAAVGLRMGDDGPTIDRVKLTTRVGMAGEIDDADFQRHVEESKQGCPVSKALAAVETIEVDATLTG